MITGVLITILVLMFLMLVGVLGTTTQQLNKSLERNSALVDRVIKLELENAKLTRQAMEKISGEFH